MNDDHVTAKKLAERFEVSIRTIYRDIDILGYAGIPIYTNKGKGGGIFLDEQYVLNKTFLTDDEQNQILMALQSNTLFDSENNSLIDKLSNIFQSSNINWIEVDYSRWANGEKDRELFNFFKESILNKNIIKIEYLSSYGEKTKREIFPMRLIYKSKAWYLQAFDKNKKDFRSFRLSRIINYNNQEEKFERADYLPLPEFDNYDSSKEKGKKGLVILSSEKKKPFLSEPKYLKQKGIKIADKAKPYYELLYYPFDESDEKPNFKENVKEGVIYTTQINVHTQKNML